MDRLTETRSATPVGVSPKAPLGYGEYRMSQYYLRFLNGQVGEKSERLTLLSGPSCTGCVYSGGCISTSGTRHNECGWLQI